MFRFFLICYLKSAKDSNSNVSSLSHILDSVRLTFSEVKSIHQSLYRLKVVINIANQFLKELT